MSGKTNTETVSEGSAVWASGSENIKGRWIELKEVNRAKIWLTISDLNSSASMTPKQARRLADQLYHHADRIEDGKA